MEVMQRDLKNYFGYEVSEETRLMPCWKLTVVKEADKLKTNSKEYQGDVGPSGINAKKFHQKACLRLLNITPRIEECPL